MNAKRMMNWSAGVALVLACFSTVEMTAQTTPYGWRGPDRNGIYPETGLLKEWPATGPQLLWETDELVHGYSSPVVVGDKLYVTGMNEDKTQEVFFAFTLDGKKLYQTAYSKPWDQTYPETRTTPAVDGDKAYVISGSGEIVCLNINDGSIVWKVNGGEIYGRVTGTWGTSECPLVFDDKVIYTPAGDQTTMVALNKNTGELIWKSGTLNDAGAYVSPMLITYKGKRQILGSTGRSVIGVNPETGEIEWFFREWERPAPAGRPGGGQARPGGAPGGQRPGGQAAPAGGQRPHGPSNAEALPQQQQRRVSNIAPNTPLFKDGKIFFSHGYNIGGYMLQLADDMKSVKLLWKTDVLDPHHGGYVELNGIIYGSNWVNNNNGNWCAVDWNTGEAKYETAWTGGKGKGSIIAADGMLYCYDERRGYVGLVRPSAEKFDLVSEFRISKGVGPHWAHPVIVNGVMYIRHGSALMAYKVK